MGYELFLFDFDGTLVDTVGDIAYHVNRVLTAFGQKRCSVSQVKRSIGMGVHELLKGVSPLLAHDAQRLEQAVELFKKSYRENPVRKTRPFPGVARALAGPLKNVTKAIITNKPQDITLRILEALDLKPFFKLVIGMHADHPPKPAPDAVLHAMKKFRAKPASTVYIGDSRIDAKTCVNAGIDFVWMDYGYDRVDGFLPRFKFSSARDWEKLLRTD